MNYFLERPPAWELVAVELWLDRAPVRSATGRRRSPDPIPITTVKRLIVELARRRDTENPRREPLTQTGIAQGSGSTTTGYSSPRSSWRPAVTC